MKEIFTDSQMHYALVDLPSYPLVSEVSFPHAAPRSSSVAFGNKDMLTREMSELLREIGFELDYLILWTWNHFLPVRSAYQIHSDGIITQFPRGFAINWVIEGDSCVEWYSYKNASPVFTTKSKKPDDKFTITEWHYGSPPPPLSRWEGNGPAILNIKQPHSVILNGETTRKTITMRFLPNVSMEEAVIRFGSRVISINR